MALVPCPECDEQTSDRARACPHCGFPVAEEVARALAKVTGHDRIRSARQRAAAGKLLNWSEGYTESSEAKRQARREMGFFERYRTIVLWGGAIVIVILQLIVLFASF